MVVVREWTKHWLRLATSVQEPGEMTIRTLQFALFSRSPGMSLPDGHVFLIPSPERAISVVRAALPRGSMLHADKLAGEMIVLHVGLLG